MFTTAEFRSALVPTLPSTVNNRLQQAYRRGYVDRVTRGVFVSRVGVFADTVPDPFLVASKLAPDSVIAYHSALEALGVAHSPFRRVTYLSARTPTRVGYRGYEFVGLRPRPDQLGEGTWRSAVEQVRRGRDALITVTSRERTIADCLDRPRWSGGLEELLRSVGGFPSLDAEKLLLYLDVLGSPAVVARVGWVLFSEPDAWHLNEEDREEFERRIGKGPYFLGPRGSGLQFVKEWRLYVPSDIDPAEFVSH